MLPFSRNQRNLPTLFVKNCWQIFKKQLKCQQKQKNLDVAHGKPQVMENFVGGFSNWGANSQHRFT